MQEKPIGKMYTQCLSNLSKMLTEHKPAFRSIKVCKGKKSVEDLLRDYKPLDDNRV